MSVHPFVKLGLVACMMAIWMAPAAAQSIRSVDNPFAGMGSGIEIAPAAAPGLPPPMEVPSVSGSLPENVIAEILAQSQASYRGACGCPDDTDRGGRRCGKRSAYSKSGGASLLCYPSDVTASMVERFLSRR